jgi:dTDP-4-dehydrorhamnose 3,5-epimerase
MRFLEAKLPGAWLIEPEPVADHRGHFMRTFCAREFADHGLEVSFPQHSLSFSKTKGSLRGMHFQRPPHAEVKVVSCSKGALWDVIVDLRPGSPTRGQWQGFELSAENGRQLYIPAGFAHGFQTLSDNVEARYLISQFYVPSASSGVRYDDPAFRIPWPLPVTSISEKDSSWPAYDPDGTLHERPD